MAHSIKSFFLRCIRLLLVTITFIIQSCLFIIGIAALLLIVKPLYMLARLLIAKKKQLPTLDQDVKLLHFYVNGNNLTKVQELINKGTDVNALTPASDGFKSTPLALAAYRGHYALVKLLIEHGALINPTNHNGLTPLILASMQGHHEIVHYLLNNGALLEEKNPLEETALVLAIKEGHLALARMLLENNAKPIPLALKTACYSGSKIGVPLLLEFGACVNPDFEDQPLIIAAYSNHGEIVELLLRHDANIESVNNEGCNALHFAAHQGYTAVVTTLLNHDAQIINSVNNFGHTALILAAKNGHVDVIKLLLERDATIELQDSKGRTAIYYACQNNHQEIVSILLSHGANVYTPDLQGQTPYDLALTSDDQALIALLGSIQESHNNRTDAHSPDKQDTF